MATEAPVVGLAAAVIDELSSILDLWGVAVDAEVLPYYEQVFQLGGYSAVVRMAELGRAPADIEELWQPYMAEASARHVARARDRLLNLGDEAWARARTVLLDGIDHGEPIDTIATNLRGVVDLTRAQATSLARTEVISAANAGAFEQAQLLGEEAPLYKQWMATRDARTRPSHVAADGQVQPLDVVFDVGQTVMMHPGDLMGLDAEIINCRCSIAFTDDPEGFDPDMPGRQEGGPIEAEATFADFHGDNADLPVPEAHGIDDIRAAIEAFQRFPMPAVPLTPDDVTVEWLAYEQERRRIGAMLDQLIRDELGDMPAMEVSAEWIDGYRTRLRDHLADLGIDFMDRDEAMEAALGAFESPLPAFTASRGVGRLIDQSMTSLPRKWVEHLLENPMARVVYRPQFGDAAFYNPETREITVGSAEWVSTIIHEVNHHLAITRPGIHSSEWTLKFLRETAIDAEGQITWEFARESSRMAGAFERPDIYPQSYMGRQYGNRAWTTRNVPSPTYRDYRDAGELWTSSIEMVLNYQTPAELSRPWRLGYGAKLFQDRQIMAWVLSVLTTL